MDAATEVFREAMRDTVKRYSLWYLIGVQTEQGTSARKSKHKRQAELPLWLQERIAEQDREGAGWITPLESNALGLRYATLRPGPAFAEVRPERARKLRPS